MHRARKLVRAERAARADQTPGEPTMEAGDASGTGLLDPVSCLPNFLLQPLQTLFERDLRGRRLLTMSVDGGLGGLLGILERLDPLTAPVDHPLSRRYRIALTTDLGE